MPLRPDRNSLTGLGQERIFVFIHGRNGGEGKTTLTTLLGMLLCDYARAVSNRAFDKTRWEQRFSMASLQGYRFVLSNEIEKGEEFASARLKEATGGGFMEIERKASRPSRWRLPRRSGSPATTCQRSRPATRRSKSAWW